jgi:hypothetical protein
MESGFWLHQRVQCEINRFIAGLSCHCCSLLSSRPVPAERLFAWGKAPPDQAGSRARYS